MAVGLQPKSDHASQNRHNCDMATSPRLTAPTSQYLPSKELFRPRTFGPWLVTEDEFPDPPRLTLETRPNGQVVQHATTDLMITPIPEQIAYISAALPLLPGDVIVSGTRRGVGAGRNPPLFMRPGDVVEVEISAIGVLRNPVVAEAA
jgi:2-keto-4-pentenoate hydratase/2-oxohepta-3-ene-1,7-dioic acid hydratase in catechol pathway